MYLINCADYAKLPTTTIISEYWRGYNTSDYGVKKNALDELRVRYKEDDELAKSFLDLYPDLKDDVVILIDEDVTPTPNFLQKLITGLKWSALNFVELIPGSFPLDLGRNILDWLKHIVESNKVSSLIFYSLAAGTAVTGIYPVILSIANALHKAQYNKYFAFGTSMLGIFVSGFINMIASVQDAGHYSGFQRFTWLSRICFVSILLIGSGASGYLAFGAGKTMVQVFTLNYPLIEKIIGVFLGAMNSASTYFSLDGITKYLVSEFSKIKESILQLNGWGIACIVGIIMCFPFLIIYSHSIAKTIGLAFDQNNINLLHKAAYDLSLTILAAINLPTLAIFVKSYPTIQTWFMAAINKQNLVINNPDGTLYKCRMEDIPLSRKIGVFILVTILTTLSCMAAAGNGLTVGQELFGSIGGGMAAGWAAAGMVPPAIVAGITFANSVLGGLAHSEEQSSLLVSQSDIEANFGTFRKDSPPLPDASAVDGSSIFHGDKQAYSIRPRPSNSYEEV